MPGPVSIHSPGGKWIWDFAFNLSAAAAVVANADGSTSTDPLVSVVKAGVGTYTVTIPGNYFQTISKFAQMNRATPTSQFAEITAVSLGGGVATPSGESTTTFTIKTMDDNATPTASDAAAVATIDCHIVMQKNKI